MSMGKIFAALLLIFGTGGPAGAQDEETALFHLAEAEGAVLYSPAGQYTWVSAAPGQPLRPGDRLKTPAGGRAELTSEEGDVVEIHENSLFTMEKTGAEECSLSAQLGKFLFNILHKPERKFLVRTPLNTIAIRGTEFAVVQTDEGWEGGVEEGQIDLVSTGSPDEPPVSIGANQGFQHRPGQRPVRLAGWPPRAAPLRGRFIRIRQKALELRRQRTQRLLEKRRDLRHKAIRQMKGRGQKR